MYQCKTWRNYHQPYFSLRYRKFHYFPCPPSNYIHFFYFQHRQHILHHLHHRYHHHRQPVPEPNHRQRKLRRRLLCLCNMAYNNKNRILQQLSLRLELCLLKVVYKQLKYPLLRRRSCSLRNHCNSKNNAPVPHTKLSDTFRRPQSCSFPLPKALWFRLLRDRIRHCCNRA